MKITRCFGALVLAASLFFPSAGFGRQNDSNGSAQKSAPNGPRKGKGTPSAQEVAEAKAKGLVWVNLATHVYHKEGPRYGTTKHGKFMLEEDAKKAGYRLASDPVSAMKSATAGK